MNYDVKAKGLNCPNCGSKLNIPKNTTGIVVCESCGTRCVLSGLNVNDEILKKNNINSGIPLVEASGKIHDAIFSFITSSKYFSIDVLQNIEITEERRICVPAYLYTCSAFASYQYEAGNQRQRDNVVGARGTVVTTHQNYTEWTQMSSIANDTRTLVVCGNNKYMEPINAFYSNIDPSRLVDIEDLDYPEDTETESFNVPYASAFSTYVKPAINAALKDNVFKALQHRNWRNLLIGQANIQKEYEARVSLGIYLVKFTYNKQEFTMYFNSDGSNYLIDVGYPEDTARLDYVNRLVAEKNQITSTWFYDLFHGGFSKIKENKELQNQQRTDIQQRIDSILAEPEYAKQSFIKSNCHLKGIYSEGNDQFVWDTPNPEVPITTNPFTKKINSSANSGMPQQKNSNNSGSYQLNNSNQPTNRSSRAPVSTNTASKGKSKSNNIVAIILIVFFLFAAFSSCVSGTGSYLDRAHDAASSQSTNSNG